MFQVRIRSKSGPRDVPYIQGSALQSGLPPQNQTVAGMEDRNLYVMRSNMGSKHLSLNVRFFATSRCKFGQTCSHHVMPKVLVLKFKDVM